MDDNGDIGSGLASGEVAVHMRGAVKIYGVGLG